MGQKLACLWRRRVPLESGKKNDASISCILYCENSDTRFSTQGPVRIVRKLAEGGFSFVYVVVDAAGHTRALKVARVMTGLYLTRFSKVIANPVKKINSFMIFFFFGASSMLGPPNLARRRQGDPGAGPGAAGPRGARARRASCRGGPTKHPPPPRLGPRGAGGEGRGGALPLPALQGLRSYTGEPHPTPTLLQALKQSAGWRGWGGAGSLDGSSLRLSYDGGH